MEEEDKELVEDAPLENENTEAESTPQEPETEEIKQPKVRLNFLAKLKSNRPVIFAIIGIIIVGLTWAGLRFYDDKNQSNNIDSQNANSQESVINDDATPEDEAQPEEQTEEYTWRDGTELVYIPVFDQESLFTYYHLNEYAEEGTTPESMKIDDYIGMYDIGDYNGQKLIMIRLQENTMAADSHIVMIEIAKDKQYSLLAKHMSGTVIDGSKYAGPDLSSIAKIDGSLIIDELSVPDSINYGGVKLSVDSSWSTTWSYYNKKELAEMAKVNGDSTVSPKTTKIADYGAGLVNEIITEYEDSGMKKLEYRLELPSGIMADYSYATDELKNDGSMSVTWDNGTSTNDSYSWSNMHRGCGGGGMVDVLDVAYHKNLKATGKNSNGTTIYELDSTSNKALITAYEIYAGPSDGRREDAVSIDKFYKNHGVVFIKNELGFYIALSNAKYGRYAECAKPVIYLYPEEVTNLSVRVGADVRQSDPLYRDGWDVLAFPDGMLVNEDGVFESLFWDGQGHGTYPGVTSGFVVKTEDVESTLIDHLAQLGLNQKESADFLEYWLPLMPEKPYVRLTWFGTQQMNELAPLTISQQPDTLIRIFLDYEGLDEYRQIKPQTLSSPARDGFTVVEWGGLRAGR